MRTLWQDVRYATRILTKNPAFALVAIVTLALGIGANTAIFSLIDTVILRALPVRDPQRLVVFKWIARNSPNTKGDYSYMACPLGNDSKSTSHERSSAGESGEHGCSFSYPMFQQFQSLADVFTGSAALGGDVGLTLRGNGPATMLHGELVSGEFFDTLGVSPALGRTLAPSDDKPGAPAVAVLGYGYWQSAFGGDSSVIGRTIWLNNVSVAIVGVAAKGFPDLDPARNRPMWLPLSLQAQLGRDMYGHLSNNQPSVQAGDANWWLYIVARLKPGVSLDKAQAAAEALFRNDVLSAFNALFKADDAPRLVLMPAPKGLSALRDRFSTPLQILMSAVGVVLLIACANIAGLMLARSAARQRELAVRLALGAGRARIARQLLTESVLLSIAGGTSGILLSYWGIQSLVAFMSRGGLWPSHLTVRLDWRILLFTTAASILTGIFFGLAPAFRGMRVDLTPALKESAAVIRGGSTRRRWWNLGGALVIAQVALSVLILSGAGLLVRTLQNLKGIDPGFDTRNVLLFRINPTLNNYTEAQTRNLYSELQQRLEALPGVLSTTYSFDSLLSGNFWHTSFHIQGDSQNTRYETDGFAVGPKFLETMRIPILSGHSFNAADFNPAPGSTSWPVVINDAFAQHFLKDQQPVGRILTGVKSNAQCEIIGVVGNIKHLTLRKELAPTIYVPQRGGDTVFEVRTAADPAIAIPAIRSVVSQIDNNLPLSSITTQSDQIQGSLFQEQLVAQLSAFFGVLSLLLACVGLYGLLTYEVTRRTHELGVRVALGAQPRDILRFVIAQGAGLSAVGAAVGILAALAVTRYLASLLYGVRPDDPFTFATVAILLAVVAILACYIPARRATRVDPLVALRYE
jgi:predicted permease